MPNHAAAQMCRRAYRASGRQLLLWHSPFARKNEAAGAADAAAWVRSTAVFLDPDKLRVTRRLSL